MKQLFISLFSAGLLLLNACIQIEVEIPTLKVDPYDATEINISEFVDTIEYIKLETKPECLIGQRIYRVTLRDKFIYVHDIDQHAIFIFDKQGKYVDKLNKQGRGPGEYVAMGASFIDENEENIDVISRDPRQHKLIRYSNINFKLMSIDSLPAISANSVRRVNDIYYYGCQGANNLVNDNLVNAGIIIVKNGVVIKTLFLNEVSKDNSLFSYNPETFTVNSENEIFASIMFDNTFYQITDNEAIPIYRVDFGKYNIDEKLKSMTTPDRIKYWQQNPLKVQFPMLHVNTSNLLLFTYNFNKSEYQYISLKNYGKVFHAKRINNDITGFPQKIVLSSASNGINHEVWDEGYLIEIIFPSNELKNFEDSVSLAGLGKVTLNDNPIIVRMKLKEL